MSSPVSRTGKGQCPDAELKKAFIDYDISMVNVEVVREDIVYAEENRRIPELKYKEGLQAGCGVKPDTGPVKRRCRGAVF